MCEHCVCLSMDMCVRDIMCVRVCWVCMFVSECMQICMFVFAAHCGLKAEPCRILRNRELAEYSQASAVDVVNAATGFGATEGARRAASILVLVAQRGVGQGSGTKWP